MIVTALGSIVHLFVIHSLQSTNIQQHPYFYGNQNNIDKLPLLKTNHSFTIL